MRMFLGIAGLMLMWFFCGTGCAQPKEIAPPEGRWPRSVTGSGETVDTAKDAAIREAKKVVSIAMKLRDPPLQSFVVDEDYVRTHVVLAGEPGKDVEMTLNDGKHVFKSWVVFFRTDGEWWKDIEKRDREAQRKHRADTRQTLGLRIVIGLASLLLAGFAYVRLDEYTKRRHTKWLRVAGVGVATTVIAALWWVFSLSPG
jgi:hypothetical protein